MLSLDYMLFVSNFTDPGWDIYRRSLLLCEINMTNALEIRNLKKSFGNLEVIRGLSLTAKRAKLYALLEQVDQERVPYYVVLIF